MTNLALLSTLTDNICKIHDVDPNDIDECLALAKKLNNIEETDDPTDKVVVRSFYLRTTPVCRFKNITYTDKFGNMVTEELVTEKSYKIMKGSIVKIWSNKQNSVLKVVSDNGNCTNGDGDKGVVKGFKFTMPNNRLGIDITDFYNSIDIKSNINVHILYGSVAIEPLT